MNSQGQVVEARAPGRVGRAWPRALWLLIALACLLLPATAGAAPNETLVSSRSTGEGPPDGAGFATQPGISDDGRLVVFSSTSQNLAVGDANQALDVFVRDHGAFPPTTTLVSRTSDGLPGDGQSNTPSISGNGRFVVFNSRASNFVANDSNSNWDTFVYDRQLGTTVVVSRSNGAGPPDAAGSDYQPPSISDDGRFVAFVSDHANIVEGAPTKQNVFVRDRDPDADGIFDEADAQGAPKNTWVSRPRGGEPAESPYADKSSTTPWISGDGRHVAFRSVVTNLVEGRDTNGKADLFVRDLRANTTTYGAEGQHPSLSADGRFLAFHVDAAFTGAATVHVRDRRTDTTTVVSRASDGGQANGGSFWAGISPDGRFVGFRSGASNLVAGDANAKPDLFVRDLQEQTTRLESRPFNDAAPGGAGGSVGAEPGPSMADGGRFVAFDSSATNLVPGDVNGRSDVFRRELALPPPAPTVSVGDVSVDEGDSGEQTEATFTLELSKTSGQTVAVDYASADDSATAPGDYASADGTASFAPNERTKTVTVKVNGDSTDEPDERFLVKLSNPDRATIADAQGVGTILDDDAPTPTPTPTVSINDVSVTEGNSGERDATFTVSLSGESDQPVTVDYATANNTATAPADYTQASDTVTVPAGTRSQTLKVKVQGDTKDEPDERFLVNLSNPSQNAKLGDDRQGVGTILDDDQPPPPPPPGDGGGSPPPGGAASPPPAGPQANPPPPAPPARRPSAAQRCRTKYRGRRAARRRRACLTRVAVRQCKTKYRGRRNARRRSACLRRVAVRHCQASHRAKRQARRRAACIRKAKRRYR